MGGPPAIGVLTKPVFIECGDAPGPPTTSSRDADGTRYRASYFDRNPGIWRQGDWIEFTERSSCVINGTNPQSETR
jgi:acetoacetyl-CoA synthetase